MKKPNMMNKILSLLVMFLAVSAMSAPKNCISLFPSLKTLVDGSDARCVRATLKAKGLRTTTIEAMVFPGNERILMNVKDDFKGKTYDLKVDCEDILGGRAFECRNVLSKDGKTGDTTFVEKRSTIGNSDGSLGLMKLLSTYDLDYLFQGYKPWVDVNEGVQLPW